MKCETIFNGVESSRLCRHLLEGTIEMPKLCLCHHDCRHCGYDQWLEETGRAERQPPETAVAALAA